MSVWNEATWFSILTAAAIKGAAVLAVAWCVAWILRARSAAERHLLWTAAFAAILVMPFLSAALPAWRVPVAAEWLQPTAASFHDTAVSTNPGIADSAAAAGAPAPVQAGTWRPHWGLWLMLMWAAGSALAFVRMLVSYAAAWRLRRLARPLPGGDRYGRLAEALGIRRPVDILESSAGSMPVTFGFRHAAILIPADAAGWSEDRRNVVLLHELAHVRRREAATHLLARTAVAVYWWNPLAWLGWHEFLKERERAADDLVLNTGARASDYGNHLLEVARSLQSSPVTAWATAAMARRSQLEGRLLAILDSGIDRSAPRRATVWAAALMSAVLILPLAAVRAQDSDYQAVPADIEAAIRVAQSQKDPTSLEAAARAATQVKQYDVAQKLLEAAVAIREQKAGAQSVEYGVGLIKLGELVQKKDPAAGADLYAKAAQILGQRPQAAQALGHLGVEALMKKDYAKAFEYFQQAQAVDPPHAGTALMWMAVVRYKEKNPEEADRLFQSALAAADPDSLDAATIMRVYTRFLTEQNRTEQAAETRAHAEAISKASAKPLPPLPAGVYRMGSGITAPVPLKREEPDYTEAARLAMLQGTVVVQVVIGTDGLPHNARIVRDLGLGLGENALEAISQWQFKPGSKDGQPVQVAATIEVNFRLL